MQSTQTMEKTKAAAPERLRLGLATRGALPWALFVMALSAAGIFAYMWQSSIGSEAAESELRAEARRFVLALTNFGSDTIESDVEGIRSHAAGSFADEVDELFGTETIAAIKKADATSTGSVEKIFVQEMDENSASVFAVVSEEVSNKNIAEPRTDIVRMELGLAKLGDRWKIDRVELFQTPANP
jgi:Mce-associated membrane protein